jgi:hypothetical protein
VTLQRLVLTFKPEGVEIRALYRTQNKANPGTKARLQEVTGLVRAVLKQALEALECGTECVGTSGFTTRGDVLLAIVSPNKAKLVKESR